MYYIRINEKDSNKLDYYCRNCGNEDVLLATSNICISKTQIQKSEQTFNHIVNKFTKFDPTLPRIKNILCPNTDCDTNTKHTDVEIIYLRYDDTNMKYIYLCSTCDTLWQSNSKV
jgi:hypothetical protein